jgi:hypothetical protein
MNSINLDNIQTKEQLQLMLFQFHNNVNSRTKHSLFEYNKLVSTYKLANTSNIISNFFHFFSKPTFSGRMGTDVFHRTQMIRDLKGWLTGNIKYFDP